MTLIGWLQAAVIFALVCVLVKPVGAYMARVLEGERVFLTPVLRRLGGIVVPFIGIKAIDLILVGLHLTGAH